MACFATSSFHEESGPVCVALGLLSAGKAGMAADINAAVAYVEREFHIFGWRISLRRIPVKERVIRGARERRLLAIL
jgi:hypothetical protein